MPPPRFAPRLLAASALVVAGCRAAAQDRLASQQPDWEARADSVVGEPDAKYAAILAAMRPVRHSDSLMDYLRRRAAEVGHASAESFAVGSLGVIHRNCTAYDTAVALHDRALALAEAADDTLARIVALNSRGVVLRRADRVTEALDAHQAALALGRRVAEPDFGTLRAIAISLNSTGHIHLTLNQLDAAEEAFRASMAVEERNGNTLGLAINHANLAAILEQRGELDGALEAYRVALAYNDVLDSDFGRAICWTGMARVLTRQGSHAMALRYVRDALPVVEARGDDHYVAAAELAYGEVLTNTGNYPVARRHLERGRDLAAGNDLVDEEARAYRLLTELEQARGDSAAAFAHFRRAVALERRVLNEKNQRYVAALNAQYASELREAEIESLARENELVRERAGRTRRNFIGLAVLLGLVAAILAVLYRQRRLVLQRDLSQLEQQRLASQMNPHFLFNALNSVKSYLVSRQGDAAIDYLTHFATLMRRILASTIDEEVALTEELENSRLYVAIENARFDGAIDLRIDVADDVDPDFLTVPPLVLQPFLENALWHGLRLKDGPKVLELAVVVGDDEELTVTIRDNGVGRAAARREAARRTRKRQSVGLDITRRRLEHFARRHDREAGFLIRDLVAADGTPEGTEVAVRIG